MMTMTIEDTRKLVWAIEDKLRILDRDQRFLLRLENFDSKVEYTIEIGTSIDMQRTTCTEEACPAMKKMLIEYLEKKIAATEIEIKKLKEKIR